MKKKDGTLITDTKAQCTEFAKAFITKAEFPAGDGQYGFRNSHSCSDLAYSVIGSAMAANNNRQVLYLLQTDIAGAFDRVNRNQLTGLKGKLFQLIKSYLTDRTFNGRSIRQSLFSIVLLCEAVALTENIENIYAEIQHRNQKCNNCR
ncbi:hypothetical protein CAPTEDRAFT_186360 [Capitella teleta]|uniref:Reverse transcriptase domain-containing protein n=1 Tax=Capitella teleta TaxID=283909 RepID=R7TSX8_CAPTE|nr:hypothetical protein CAPTEDRAFT_186360 [Capitella teleta]|eukprot:ELT96712.1 hypothetical protein CAPTEDRAFT_186360 [Capitella teleta]